MKPLFEAVSPTSSQSFLVRQFTETRFSAPFHYHPEIELTFIVQGEGKRYIGSNVQQYAAGDFVLVGKNLPHCWKSNEDSAVDSKSIVIHFLQDFLGPEFLARPELSIIKALFESAANGIFFPGNMNEYRSLVLQIAEEQVPFRRLMLLLDLLYRLAITENQVRLDQKSAFPMLRDYDKQRINTVMHYVVENYHGQIKLKHAADSINMTPNAFCKYFKKVTRKTFVEAVNDYRIDHAVHALVHSNKSVTAIGFESGFNDLSNFYKVFRQKLRVSPLVYRKTFKQVN